MTELIFFLIIGVFIGGMLWSDREEIKAQERRKFLLVYTDRALKLANLINESRKCGIIPRHVAQQELARIYSSMPMPITVVRKDALK